MNYFKIKMIKYEVHEPRHHVVIWTDQSNYCTLSSYIASSTKSNRNKTKVIKKLNVEVKEFRPNRTTGAIALAKIKDIAEHDDSEND